VAQLNTDTPVLWSWNGSAATLTRLPNLATPPTPPVNGAVASAITPDASYIASQARSNVANPFEVGAVRVARNGLVNLNLSAPPFPALIPSSAALSMSADGSIVYAIAGNPIRAFRFDVNASSRSAIPLLLGSHTGNVVIARGTSYDGSVAVGHELRGAMDRHQRPRLPLRARQPRHRVGDSAARWRHVELAARVVPGWAFHARLREQHVLAERRGLSLRRRHRGDDSSRLAEYTVGAV
jgi:hypothetical protein